MKIKKKMVELKDKSINFVKEHKYDIMVIGLYTAVDLAFYSIGRRDGRIERDRDWQKELDGKRARRYFGMYVTNDDDTVKVTDLGKIGGEMIDLYKEKKDISNERVTHMMIITDPKTGN